jgi:hypothetical protein
MPSPAGPEWSIHRPGGRPSDRAAPTPVSDDVPHPGRRAAPEAWADRGVGGTQSGAGSTFVSGPAPAGLPPRPVAAHPEPEPVRRSDDHTDECVAVFHFVILNSLCAGTYDPVQDGSAS